MGSRTGAAVDDVAFSADGSLLASATAEQLDIFDVLTGTLQFSLPCASLPGHTLPPLQVDFTVDGLLMVSCCAQSSACQYGRVLHTCRVLVGIVMAPHPLDRIECAAGDIHWG